MNNLKKFFAFFYLLSLVVFPAEAKAPDTVPALLGVESDGSQVTLELSQLMPYDVTTLSSPARLVIEIPGTLYKTGFAKKNVNGEIVRRIRGYQFRENPLIARVVIDLAEPADYNASASDNKVVIALRKNDLAAVEEPKKAPVKRSSATSGKRDLLASLPKEQVTLDFEGADIRDVIRLMAETSNINIIFGPEVGGTIAIHLKKVPFDEAFSTILNLKGLVASQLGSNILRVTTPDILQRERQKAIVYTKNVPVNYLKAEEMAKHLSAVMSTAGRKGTITVVAETNSLVITDSEEGIQQAERLITQLDKRPKQVMIEARIVEINLNNGFDIGVTWEYGSFEKIKRDPLTGAITKTNTIGGGVQQEAPLLFDGEPFGREDDFGAAAPSNRGTGVSLPGPTSAAISFGFVKRDAVLQAALSALITQSKAKILSAPKVVTVNGAAAKIEAVQDIRFQTSTVSNGVVSTNFQTVSAGIVLNVTPTINAEDSITLIIKPESSFPTQESTDAGPIIRTRTAQTTVIIKDGETLVIGGLIDDQDTKGVSKVPILGDIPILGVFFRSNTSRKIRNELLVFVTPRIVRE